MGNNHAAIDASKKTAITAVNTQRLCLRSDTRKLSFLYWGTNITLSPNNAIPGANAWLTDQIRQKILFNYTMFPAD